MRAVIQRVTRARVAVEGRTAGEISSGLLILLGVGKADNPEASSSLAEKIANLRIFSDEAGKMNRSILDTGGSALVVSQFTLYGDTRWRPAAFVRSGRGAGRRQPALRRVYSLAAVPGSARRNRRLPGAHGSGIGE